MTELAATLPRVRNYNVAVTEQDGRVVFLHRIVDGGADRSYGIHVAELAGMPAPVIERAREVLEVARRRRSQRRPERRARRRRRSCRCSTRRAAVGGRGGAGGRWTRMR